MSEGQPEKFNSKSLLKAMTSKSGVYRMLDTQGSVIYVGKAKNLKKRLTSYFTRALTEKTLALVNQIAHIDVTVTRNEGEALLLEDNLIKKYQPKYNILLRDDKSYPYIYVSTHKEYPGISVYRGVTRNKPGKFFGPYPAATAVRQTVHLIHKLFRIRQCNDTYFKNRSRPCLQYQIKRCSGPCVGLISPEQYRQDIEHAELFLDGKTADIIDTLIQSMDEASSSLAYEKAAEYRDQINQLRLILDKQYVTSINSRNIDVIACIIKGNQCCIQVFYFREGRNIGNKAFFPRLPSTDLDESAIVEAFISQYYLSHDIPAEIIASHQPADSDFLVNALSEKSGKQVQIKYRVRGERAKWVDAARQNAIEALNFHQAEKSNYQKQLQELQLMLDMEDLPKRIECFDISHTQGKQTVASCVVFNSTGPSKSDYRRFNIKDIKPGDDYAAMAQVLERRYSRILKEEGALPDVIFVDGGKGQLSRAMETLEPLFAELPVVAGISKGPGRKAGMEIIHLASSTTPIEIGRHPSASIVIQQIRDEAHRFAITGHRQRARKQATKSTLENIEGLGPKRRQRLLQSFGGIHGIKRAGVDDLKSIHGISHSLAQRIYEYFHNK